jgi:hypothetical protein
MRPAVIPPANMNINRVGADARQRSTKAGGHPAGEPWHPRMASCRAAGRSTKAGGHPAGEPVGKVVRSMPARSAQRRPAVIPPANCAATLPSSAADDAQRRPAVIPPANVAEPHERIARPDRSTKAGGHPAGERARTGPMPRPRRRRSTKAGGHPAGERDGQRRQGFSAGRPPRRCQHRRCGCGWRPRRPGRGCRGCGRRRRTRARLRRPKGRPCPPGR